MKENLQNDINAPLSNQDGSEQTPSRIADRSNKSVFFNKRKGGPLTPKEIEEISYKNVNMFKKFTSEGGRILAARITGVSNKVQRKIKREIKIARLLGLLPFVSKFD